MGRPGVSRLARALNVGIDSGGLTRARHLMAAAGRCVVVTGAGMSVASGVPTFRGEDGLWKRHRAEDLATPEAFARDPRLVWEWYAWRRERIAACRPSRGHERLARWVLDDPGRRTVVTQNVDGLHELALDEAAAPGPAPHDTVLRLHGTLFGVRCTACAHRAAHRDSIDARTDAALPSCPACGALLRPDVVWFGEALDTAVIERAATLAGSADVCLVVGTSAVVHPAASLPLLTLRSGGAVIEVNPERTPLSGSASVHVAAGADDALQALLE